MKILILILVFVGSVFALACKVPQSADKLPAGPFADRRQLAKDIEAAIKLKKKWDSVDISKLEDNAITLHLNYRGSPSSMTEVRSDTEEIAEGIILMLGKRGYDAKTNWLALFVHAQRRESSGMRRYGKTMYDFNTGRLQFSEAGSFY